MKNYFQKKEKQFNEVCIQAERKATSIFTKAQDVLSCKKGEGFVDTAVKILISVVIGALLLAGLYALFSGTILPTLTTKIQEMFNYSGN